MKTSSSFHLPLRQASPEKKLKFVSEELKGNNSSLSRQVTNVECCFLWRILYPGDVDAVSRCYLLYLLSSTPLSDYCYRAGVPILQIAVRMGSIPYFTVLYLRLITDCLYFTKSCNEILKKIKLHLLMGVSKRKQCRS